MRRPVARQPMDSLFRANPVDLGLRATLCLSSAICASAAECRVGGIDRRVVLRNRAVLIQAVALPCDAQRQRRELRVLGPKAFFAYMACCGTLDSTPASIIARCHATHGSRSWRANRDEPGQPDLVHSCPGAGELAR